jgi:hypothetical protein
MSKISVLQGAATARPSSSTTPTGRTSKIKCHHCHGVGHFQQDCPRKKSYIATDDGGYVSASDNDDDFALQPDNARDLDDDDAAVFGSEHTAEYSTKTYVVQWILSAVSGQFRQASTPQLISDVPYHQGLSHPHNH